MCVVCDMLCVMCYVNRTLGTKGLVTMNNRMTILGLDPNFGLSFLSSKSKILAINCFLIHCKIKIFLSDCFK